MTRRPIRRLIAASIKNEPNSVAKPVAQPECDAASDIDTKVGLNFRRLALNAGWSRAKTAEALGVDPGVVSAIESGERRAGGELVVRAARLFGVLPSSFFDVDPSGKSN